VIFLTARFGGLYFIILRFEAPGIAFTGKNFIGEGPFPLFIGQSGTEVFGRTLDDGANLRKFRYLRLLVLFLIEPFWIQNRSHAEKLEVPLQLRCQISARHVIPV